MEGKNEDYIDPDLIENGPSGPAFGLCPVSYLGLVNRYLFRSDETGDPSRGVRICFARYNESQISKMSNHDRLEFHATIRAGR